MLSDEDVERIRKILASAAVDLEEERALRVERQQINKRCAEIEARLDAIRFVEDRIRSEVFPIIFPKPKTTAPIVEPQPWPAMTTQAASTPE